jgi:hypothetical protein
MPTVAKKTTKARKEAAVPDTVEAIRAEAAKRTPDPKRFAKAQRRTEAAIRGDTFEWNRSSSTVDGLAIHYFRVRNESVTGILCPAQRELWHGYTFKFACERIDVPARPPEIFDPPQLIRLPGNRLLAKAIDDAGCEYMRVKITYKGKRFKTSRHYEKVYSVESAPLNHDLGSKGRAVLAKAAADAKARKAGKS